MSSEQLLASFIQNVNYSDLDEETIKTVKLQMTAFFGAMIAGSASGAAAAADFACDMGGKPEATVFIKGGRVPAQQAAFANATMGRALDIDDHISPGAHIGAAAIPAAFATAELIGGCSGKDLITAVAAGTEVSLRLMLEEDDYAGFDPTGITSVFSTAAAASKLLGFDESLIWNALGLVSDRSGASFQHYIDGVLAGPLMQGYVARDGVESARLAKQGITGSVNYLEGVYSYFHLYGNDRADISHVTKALGREWHLKNLNFKKYPSCGLTQSSTELAINMMQEHGFTADDVEHIDILIPPFTFKLVGHPFKIGDNPRVDAQFNVAYCIANAIMRAPVTISHFDERDIRDPKVLDFLTERITVISDPAIERAHYSSDLRIRTKGGEEFYGQIDVPPGTPQNPMSADEHIARFYDCVKFSGIRWLSGREESILSYIETLEDQADVRSMIPLFLP